MSLIFYLAPRSTAKITVAVLAELEYGLPDPIAQRVELSIKNRDTRTSQYLSNVNPNGRVPAIMHDGVPIWESAAITMYLGETFGVRERNTKEKPSLYPPLGPQRGEAMKWIVWAHTTLTVAAGHLASALPTGTPGAVEEGSQDVVSMDEKARKDVGTKANDGIAQALDILDGALKGRDYLLGDQYCLADTHVWSVVDYCSIMGVSLQPHPNVQEWVKRVEKRPALKDL